MNFSFRLVAAVVCLVAAFSSAAQTSDTVPAGRPPDVRLVIDVSGSMKRNDPNNLRQPAVELLVQLLPEDSRAGVWTFGKWINMLVPHKPVTPEWREAAASKAEDINSVGLYTNIGEALEKAAYDLKSAGETHRTSIILLTDGMVDIDKSPEINQREWRRIVDDILPRLKAAGFTIHTIALSDNADKNLMNKLSLATGGMAEVAHTAEDLMRIFLKTFDAAVPSEQVPLTDNQFVIDSSVEEFTALIFRESTDQQTELIGPDQAIYSAAKASPDVKWHRAENYDLITVKQPLEGEWGVKAKMAPDSRVTVVSNLNLRVKPLPLNVFKGQQETLSLFLQEDGSKITRAEFLSLMDIQATMEAGNDEFDLKVFWEKTLNQGEPPADGRYATELPVFDKDGIYQLSVLVDGKTFIRQFNHQFHVRLPLGAEVRQVVEDGKLEYVLIATAFNQDFDIPNTQVAATVISPDGRRKIRPLEATNVDTWRATLMPEKEGEYTARIKAKGVTTSGSEFDITLEDISFNYSLEAGFVEEKEPFFEPTPTPTPVPSSLPEESPPAPTAAPVVEKTGAVSSWMLYSMLGLGNLILIGLGYLLFRKIMGKNDEVLGDIEADAADENEPPPAAPEAELESEEEPPMEDLDPNVDDDIPAREDEDLDPEPIKESPADDLDDIDSMGNDSDAGDEDDDMVAEMLKAQGLDLAEDELDEAISTLIDDLDDGDEETSDDEVEDDEDKDK